MATAKKNVTAPAAKKKNKKPKASAAKIVNLSGYDPKNSLVTFTKEGKGFRVINERVAYNEFFTVSTKAIAAYNHQINNSQRQ